jgi:hypothetical protein
MKSEDLLLLAAGQVDGRYIVYKMNLKPVLYYDCC